MLYNIGMLWFRINQTLHHAEVLKSRNIKDLSKYCFIAIEGVLIMNVSISNFWEWMYPVSGGEEIVSEAALGVIILWFCW